MLPGLLIEVPRVYDYLTEVLEDGNLNYNFKGPILGDLDMLFTVDPANIHHIMSSNFANYPKRTKFKKYFDVLGDGIFNTDSYLWKDLRKSAQTMMSKTEFQRFSLARSVTKLEKGLVPILDHVYEENLVVDLQDLFQRFTFDTTFVLATGYDPGCLSLEMQEIEFASALDGAEEAIFYRHVKPEMVWKIQILLGFGDELKLKKAQAIFDSVCSKYIATKRKENHENIDSSSASQDLLTSYINQESISKILQEIETNLSPRTNKDSSYNPQDLKKLVYLHGGICEALRLYPPVPFQHKSPTKPDILPSGHKVEASSKILFCLYSLGRMKSVWGEDAFEFKPERWISQTGTSVHEPSYKFLSSNAGPRTCLGKEMAMMQMKIVAVKFIQNF